MTVQNQALSSSNGLLYTWVTASPDWAASSFPGPGSALHIAVAMAPATAGGGGGVTDHGALTGLVDDDHTQYDLARRPLQDYTAASNDAALADARKCITTTRSSAIALRIRLQSAIAWAAETLLGGINRGTGPLTLTAEAGVTLNGTLTVPQHGWWWAKRTASNVWQVFTGGTGGGSLPAPGPDGEVLTSVGGSWVSAASTAGAGGGMGFPYTYAGSGTTGDADPGAGTFRGNNAALASVTQLYVDLLEHGGTDVTAWLDGLDDYAGAIKGIIRLQSRSDLTKWIEYALTGWTTATGYRKLAVTYLRGPGGILTTAGDTTVSFDAMASLPSGATAGQQIRADPTTLLPAWFTPTSLKRGTNLVGTANTTVTRAGGTLYEMLAGVTTAARDIRCGATSLNSTTHRRFIYAFVINAQAHDVVIKDDVAGTTLHTVPAGEKQYVVCEWDGFNFVAGDWGDLN